MGVIACTHGGHCFNTVYVCTNVVQWHGVVWFGVVYIIHSTVVWDMHAYIGVGGCMYSKWCMYSAGERYKRFISKSDLRMYVHTYVRTYIRLNSSELVCGLFTFLQLDMATLLAHIHQETHLNSGTTAYSLINLTIADSLVFCRLWRQRSVLRLRIG